MARNYSAGFKRYESQNHKKKFPAIEIGNRFSRLTVIEVLPAGCSSQPKIHHTLIGRGTECA